MTLKKFDDFMVERKGCVMMEIDLPEWPSICSMIDPADVHSEDLGIEPNPHVTVLYGLHSFVTPQEVISVLERFKSPNVQFGKIGIFDNEEFDVVKINVISQDLTNMHDALKELPCKESFYEYIPHATISYVKKGLGKKYLDHPIDFPKELTLNTAIYSTANKEKTIIKL